jgi:microcystin-dependent protein
MTPYLSEIRVFTFPFAPKGWAMCNGQLLPIQQNQALFSLMGTSYGGNGITTFALPNLQGLTPIHMGSGQGDYYSIGQVAGTAAVGLLSTQMPNHTHLVRASDSQASLLVADNALLARTLTPNYSDTSPGNVYEQASTMPTSVSYTTGSQAHTNMQPYLVLNICIALQGIFPSRT